MPPVRRPPNPIEIFYSYSHKDEELRDQLERHLSLLKRSKIITGWHDRKITAGREWKGKIDEHLKSAKVVLLLISSDFLASDYCYDVETKRALWRNARGYCRVIPVILRACDWKIALLSKLQALPKDGKPITSWRNRDEAFTSVAQGIREAMRELQGNVSTPKVRPKRVPPGRIKTDPQEPKPIRTRTKVRPTPSSTATPEKKIRTSPAKKPGAPRQSPGQRSLTSMPRIKNASVPTIESLPREAVEQYMKEAFHNRPKANMNAGWVQVVWASLRADATIKPTLFVDQDFRQGVQEIAHTGKPPLFPFGAPNDVSYNTARFQIIQRHIVRDGRGGQDLIELTIYASGVVAVAMNVTNLKGQDVSDWSASMQIDPDDVQARLEQAWGFASRWWKRRFGSRAPNDERLLYNVGMFDTQNYKFEKPKTRQHSSRTRIVSFSMRTRPNPVMIYDTPKLIARSVLLKPSGEITDIVKMLEMRFDDVDNQR